MIAMLGIESIGDDADFRAKMRGAQTHKAAVWQRALHTGRVRQLLLDEQRYESRPKAWCARITGRTAGGGFAREFLRGRKDYRESNGTGSRGVFKWFELSEGELYEVNAPQSWTAADRYFCRAVHGKVVRLTTEEVDAWVYREVAS